MAILNYRGLHKCIFAILAKSLIHNHIFIHNLIIIYLYISMYIYIYIFYIADAG